MIKTTINMVILNISIPNGISAESKVYGARDMVLLREIYRTFDKNNTLIVLESNEIAGFSSMMSHVMKYEYY